ncbi:hypothetical protein SADUNF_Sadunf17G0077600 [Salix dunnii]|uniref:Uncharacterized protein n=1 Tax=Salix dunnii TaxID=1413687 RepID=A0A835J7Y1_9ROSI|nr:hypothetical protein SADUNF_Sadunf17G0077600 [Salix dunnii]
MLYCDEIYKSIAKKEISSAALVLDESMYSLFYDANEDIESSFRNDHKTKSNRFTFIFATIRSKSA